MDSHIALVEEGVGAGGGVRGRIKPINRASAHRICSGQVREAMSEVDSQPVASWGCADEVPSRMIFTGRGTGERRDS